MSRFFSRRRPIRFVFAPAFASSGTTVMRGRQLSHIAASTSLSGRPISFSPSDVDFSRSDLFLTKGVLKTVDDRTLRLWRRNRNRLFVDPVDEDLDDRLSAAADVIVAASRTAVDDYSERWPAKVVAVVDHHVDPRAEKAMERRTSLPTDLRIAYFGELTNTVHADALASRVDFFHVDTSREDDAWFSGVADYNCHYAVRRTRELDRHKPFLKGFTAAACRSNVIIQRGQVEAEHWLPADYPFWVDSAAGVSDVTGVIDAADEAFGTSVWSDALGVMESIRSRTSSRAIGAQLVALFA